MIEDPTTDFVGVGTPGPLRGRRLCLGYKSFYNPIMHTGYTPLSLHVNMQKKIKLEKIQLSINAARIKTMLNAFCIGLGPT